MTDLTARVTGHYSHGHLADAILAALTRMGLPHDRVRPEDLAPVDEFHMGGRTATLRLIERLALGADDRLLDIGSGIGGPARHFAQQCGCLVTGIDLTPEFVAVAERLTAMTGQTDRVTFREGSATALPFDDASFTAATLIHVGMNIPDKAAVAGEAFRVLRPGGRFLLYEVTRSGPGELVFPQPWASSAEASFLEPPETYREALRAAGFAPEGEVSRAVEAKAFFAAMRERLARGEVPPLSLAQILGEERKAAFPNVTAALEADIIAPVEMLWRKPE